MDLAELADRAEINDLLARYTLAVDAQEWDRLDTVFTSDAHVDYTESGGIADAYPVVKEWLAANLPLFSQRYLHTLGQVVVEFPEGGSRDEAVVTAYFHNPMRVVDGDAERVVEVGGRYHHRLVRTPQGWRSRRLREEVVWTRGF
ncbi:nuclear transport factor 2 family protein [Nocardioides panacisoli]|uniref:nuclear transport factor 2 family protein n=1 Tax=Nocardioides panacisoli TaxID=627624 RepID=UPI001C62774C|nr:nuclear transport factor 2 family protein [Nocardioides panacisoli]QYJ02931.1 nuclear transport factor 2 family protein [Nocardioides panacisoli]